MQTGKLCMAVSSSTADLHDWVPCGYNTLLHWSHNCILFGRPDSTHRIATAEVTSMRQSWALWLWACGLIAYEPLFKHNLLSGLYEKRTKNKWKENSLNGWKKQFLAKKGAFVKRCSPYSFWTEKKWTWVASFFQNFFESQFFAILQTKPQKFASKHLC